MELTRWAWFRCTPRCAGGGSRGGAPSGAHPPPGAPQGQVNANTVQLDLSDIGNLTSTAEIVAAAMAGVIVLEIARRRVWRARRAARLAPAAVKPPGR
jgi:hypothetical protein